jgi:hypothetical protein
MGVLNMARPRQTATTATATRAPRKPAGRSSTKPASGRQKASKGREPAAKATTAKPNPFDDIARQVNADQEAKDRAAGRDDLTLAAATSVDQAKMKSSGSDQAGDAGKARQAPAADQGPGTQERRELQRSADDQGRNGRRSGEASRTQDQGRCRRRCHRGPVTGNACAVSAWLATRNGAPTKPPAKATTKQPAKAKPTQRAMSQTLVQVIAQVAVFLEFADESVLNLDAAVKQQEDMAFRLQQLGPADRREFTRLLVEVADEWPSADGRHYLRALPGAIGLT